MKARWFMNIACVLALAPASAKLLRAQNVAGPGTLASACGVNNTKFKMKPDTLSAGTITPPAGKALIYVIELMPGGNFLTTHVKVGADGNWLAQLSGQTFISVAVEPGVHHLCAQYEGSVAASGLGSTVLHRLDAEAGQTYYLLYRGVITKDAGEVGFFNLVDEDEGRYALQSAMHLSATIVKK
jgi:hypothetical protein